MRKLWVPLLTLAALASPVATGAARAEDFNFTVTVRLRALLPEVFNLKVQCCVYDGLLSGNSVTGAVVGAKSVSLNEPDANGNLTQSVTLSFNAMAGRNPATGRAWQCKLFFREETPGSSEARYPHLRPKPGTEVRTVASGSL